MYNSWMPVLAGKLKGLVVCETILTSSRAYESVVKVKGGGGGVCSVCYNSPWHMFFLNMCIALPFY